MTDPAAFAELAARLRADPNADPLILTALDLAPVALAARAYIKRNGGPLSAESYLAWDALKRADAEYEEKVK